MPRFGRPPLRSDDGATLVGLLTAMVIFSLLLMGTSDVMGGSFSITQHSMSTATAQEMTARTSERLAAEVRAAQSPDRAGLAGMSSLELLTSLLGGAAHEGVDVRDIVVAGPRRLWFRSDVVGTADVECVGYEVAADGALWRYVAPDWRSCPVAASAAADARQLLSASSSGAQPVFRYLLYAAAGPEGGCRTSPHSGETLAGSDARLNRISSVVVDLSALVSRGDAVASNAATSVVALRTRERAEYQYALGCTGALG